MIDEQMGDKLVDERALSDGEKAALMARLAMAWDGQWFLKVHEAYGWEAATQINARVRHAFGRIEMLFLLRALGRQKPKDLREAVGLLQFYVEQILGAGFSGEFEEKDGVAHIGVTRCAAWDGARRAGLERQDQACVGCPELFVIYFETLLSGHTVEVETGGQMGYGAERCDYWVRLSTRS